MLKAVKDSSYHLVAWSASKDDYMRCGTYNGTDMGADQFWMFYRQSSASNLYSLKNWWTGTWLDLCNSDYNNGGWVGVWEGNGTRAQQWYVDRNNNSSVTLIIHEPDWSNQIDWALDTTGSLGANVIIYEQAYEWGNWSNGLGSTNVNQQWWLDPADFDFDVNPDDNKYGTTYSNGAHVKSFDMKVTYGSRTTYQEKGLEDYYRRDVVGVTYHITNVKYRDGYAYKDYTLSGGEMVYAAEDGSAFTVKHTPWADITLSINTAENVFEPPAAPTKSVKITD